MTTKLEYATDVIREKTADGPFLLDGEELRHESSIAIPPSLWAFGIILLIIPPLWPFLIIIAIMIGATYYLHKHTKLWITNKRIVYSQRQLFGGYLVSSVPILEIKLVRRRFLMGFFSGLLDRLFGVSTFQILVKGKLLPQLLVTDVKDRGAFLKTIKSISAELVDPA